MIATHVKLHGHKSVKPTLRMLRYWWKKLNVEVFEDSLLPCQLSLLTEEGYEDGYQGLCWPLDNGRVRINVDPGYCTTRGGMLATLAHEMVHQRQHQTGLAMTHGDSFEQWREPILGLTGLTI